jgi:hypothetical protein
VLYGNCLDDPNRVLLLNENCWYEVEFGPPWCALNVFGLDINYFSKSTRFGSSKQLPYNTEFSVPYKSALGKRSSSLG